MCGSISSMRSIVLLCGLLLFAQQPPFRSGVELVRIPLSLSRGPEASISMDGLTDAHFSVFEDGVPQAVSLFERHSVPIRLCILLDISHSMLNTGVARLSTGAYGHIVNLLGPADALSVVTFAMSSSVALPWTAADRAARLPLQLRSQGGTAIIDAVRRALRQIDKATPGRPLILVITDGGENASDSPLSEIVETRIQSEAEIYAFRIAGLPSVTPPSVTQGRARGQGPALQTVDVLPQLVSDSGGLIYDIATDTDVPAVSKRFVDEIRSQFTLGYTPTRPFDGRYRRIKVEMKVPGYTIRHRNGYLALQTR